MASRVEVCSSFTACPGTAGRLWCCGQHRTPIPPTLRCAGPAHHHRLVQPLAPLHVRRLDVDAVRSALPAGTVVRARDGMGRGAGTGPGLLTPACP